jgi:AcrR family transcriptional regulator
MARLCAERGYPETSVEDVLELAAIDRATFDRHFGGRGGCLLAAVNAIMSETVSVVGASYSGDRSEWDSGLIGIRAILQLMSANPSFAYVGYITSRQMAEADVRSVRDTGCGFLCTMLDRLRSYSPDNEAPTLAATAAFGGAEALMRREVAQGRTERLERLLPDLIYGATVPFLGQEEASRLAGRARLLVEGDRDSFSKRGSS